VSRTTDAVDVKALPSRDPLTGEDDSLWGDVRVSQAIWFNCNIVEDEHVLN
jgi:hypothetical protein